MTEHNFCPFAFFSFLNIFFLECPCNSRTICTFCTDIHLLSYIRLLLQFVFWPAPTLTFFLQNSACSCNVVFTPSTHSCEPFLTFNHDMVKHHFLMLLFVFFAPFLNLLACSFGWLLWFVSACAVLVRFPIHAPSWTSFTWPHDAHQFLSVLCFEAFYFIFASFFS